MISGSRQAINPFLFEIHTGLFMNKMTRFLFFPQNTEEEEGEGGQTGQGVGHCQNWVVGTWGFMTPFCLLECLLEMFHKKQHNKNKL